MSDKVWLNSTPDSYSQDATQTTKHYCSNSDEFIKMVEEGREASIEVTVQEAQEIDVRLWY